MKIKPMMSREIKFRAWNGAYFHPLEDDGDYYFRDDGDGLTLHDKWGECKDTVLLQFTGLKDKNGKEIYEGDIIKYVSHTPDWNIHSEEITAVEFHTNQRFCGFYPFGCFNAKYADKIEVVGNIFENPDLITKK